MEKRDMIVIVVAILIVLIMAMYIKPLVTGKEAKLIPDEITNLISPKNESTNSENLTINNSSINQTGMVNNTTLDTNFTKNISSNVTSNESVNIGQVLTTWDGKPIQVDNKALTPIPTPTRISVYTQPTKEIITPNMTDFIIIKGNQSRIYGPFNIPSGYWDIIYSVNFRTNLGNPQSGKIFEFNKQYKEALVSYESGLNNKPIEVIYDKDGRAIGMNLEKEENKSKKDVLFTRSKNQAITKTPKEDWELGDSSLPFITTEDTAPPSSLVESVSYGLPDITLVVKNLDYNKGSDIIIKPDGGIDPLQWDKEAHKKKAEEDIKQSKNPKLTESSLYKKEWEKKWKGIKDPRPWKERIFGIGNYSISVYPNNIDSYQIDVLVPVLVPVIESKGSLSTPAPDYNTPIISEISNITVLENIPYQELWRNNEVYNGKSIRYSGVIVRKENDNMYIFRPDSWDILKEEEKIILTDLNQMRLGKNDKVIIEGIVGGLQDFSSSFDKGEIELPMISVKSIKLI